ncbi:MAG: hypothetical protein ACXW3Z_14965, partial [Limisphaerales bacterium]
MTNYFRWLCCTSRIVPAMCWWLAVSSAQSAVITNATAVNVSPSGFSVFWRAPASSTPSIEVFADAGGVTNLAGQLGKEAFPLH